MQWLQQALWGGWTLVYSPSAKLSECQKLLMLNSKRKLSKEQEQRMLFKQPAGAGELALLPSE